MEGHIPLSPRPSSYAPCTSTHYLLRTFFESDSMSSPQVLKSAIGVRIGNEMNVLQYSPELINIKNFSFSIIFNCKLHIYLKEN